MENFGDVFSCVGVSWRGGGSPGLMFSWVWGLLGRVAWCSLGSLSVVVSCVILAGWSLGVVFNWRAVLLASLGALLVWKFSL